jgi:hypothetical protein
MATENYGLNINVQTNAEGSIGSLKKQLREAQADVQKLADKFGATSNEAVNAAKKAAELKDRIGDAKALTDAYNPDQKFKALTASLSGVAGGFGAIQGAMALFGAESDNVTKTLLKVQSAMAISQGLNSVGDAIDSFKNLGNQIKATTLYQQANNAVNVIATTIMRTLGISVNTTSVAFNRLKIAIAATGIGLLVAGIAVAVNAFENFTSAAQKAEDAQKKLNKQTQDGAKIELDGAIAFLDRQQKLDIAKAKLAGETQDEIFQIEQRYRKLKIDAQQRYHNEIAQIDVKAALDTENANKLAANDAEVARLEEQKRLQDEKLQLKIEGIEFETQRIIDTNIADAERLHQVREKLGKQEVLDARKLAKLKQQDKEDFEKEAEDRALKLTQGYWGQRANAQIEQWDKDAKLDKDVKDAQLKAEQELTDAKFNITFAGLNLLTSLAGRNEALANTIFIIERALAIAQIIVNTQREISAISVANAPLGLKGIPITAGQILAAKLRAGVGIATIAATSIAKFKSGASGASAALSSMPTVSSAAPITPELPRAATTNISQQSINDIGNNAVRAYVVESDVTSSQERITAIRQRARFS